MRKLPAGLGDRKRTADQNEKEAAAAESKAAGQSGLQFVLAFFLMLILGEVRIDFGD